MFFEVRVSPKCNSLNIVADVNDVSGFIWTGVSGPQQTTKTGMLLTHGIAVRIVQYGG